MNNNGEIWSSRFVSSLWSATDESWEEDHEDWRIVGSNPFARRPPSERTKPDDLKLYIVGFRSKRLDIGYITGGKLIEKDVHVILEADRGEDCGVIRGSTTMERWQEFLRSNKEVEDNFKLKKIYRIATSSDLEKLEDTKTKVVNALCACKNHVKMMGLKMEILECEYQFDLNKITFFYRSVERIDFRELVRCLYKMFKTRIWMCSVDKSVDGMLMDILVE